MKSSREHLLEVIKKIIAEDAGLRQILSDVLESFSRNDFRRAEKLLFDSFGKYHLTVRKLAKANNSNYVAYKNQTQDEEEIVIQIEDSSSDDEARDSQEGEIVIAIEDSSVDSEEEHTKLPTDKKIIIQLCRKSPEAVKADDILAKAQKYEWQQVGDMNFIKKETKDTQKYEWQVDSVFSAKTPAKDFPDDCVYMTVMEHYHTLNNVIDRLRAQNDPAACIQVARSIGCQLSSILTTLTAHRLIWTDMKPGNLLLTFDYKVVIADTKGIVEPSLIPKRKKTSKTLIFGEISPAFVSEDFLKFRYNNASGPEEAKAIWEREYSYQLAVTLHALATASPPRESQEGGDTSFDFSHPVFATETGQRLQYIIFRLGDNQLLDRMHHEDAAELLRLIDEPQAFAALQDKVELKIAAAKEASESMYYKGYGIRTPKQIDELVEAMHQIEIANARHEEAKAQEGWAILKKLKGSLTKLRKSSKEPDISGPLSPVSESRSMRSSSESSESPPPLNLSRASEAGLKPKREGRGGSGKGSGKQRSLSLSSAVQSFMTSPRKNEKTPAKSDEKKARSPKSPTKK